MPSRKKRSPLDEAAEAEKVKIQREQELLEERARNIEKLKLETKQRSLRTAILFDSVQRFENLLHKVIEHKKPIRDEDEWQRYLKCEELPNTKVPSDVRSFMYKWRNSLNDHWDQQINWWLKCDDRSVLTQTPEKPDMRRKLMQKLRVPVGKFFDQMLRLLIKVYNSLLETIRRRKVSSTHLEDLLTIRDALRETALNFLDVLTFEVLLHIDREMVSINALMSNYSFSAPDFIMFVWSFKDVPLPESYLRLIQMDQLNMYVTVSNRFDLSSSTVRGLWFKHDFFSDHCHSLNAPMPMKFIDLATVVNEEMALKKSITEKHLERMRKERDAYELMMEEKLKEEEANNKSKKNKGVPSKKAEKNKKLKKQQSKVKFVEPAVPPVVDESTYVDVEDEYLMYEEAQVKEDLEPNKPENLGLSEHEVNMRNFQVTNGVFKIEGFEKPSQTREINFQMFLRLNENPNIIKLKPFHHIYELPEVTVKKDESEAQIAKKVVDAKHAALADLMKIEVKLNTKFFWWECPTVCRWEPWEESDEFSALDHEMQDFNLHYDDCVKREENKLFSTPITKNINNPKYVRDFDLTSSQNAVKLSTLFRNYLVPIMPNNFDFFDDKLRFYNQQRREWLDELEVQKQQDFNRITKEEFTRKFLMKAFRPHELFPVERRQLLNILDNPEITKSVISEREKLHKDAKKLKEEDGDEMKPLKNEPQMLSELLQEITATKSKLRPVFRDSESTRSISTVSLQISIDLKDQKKDPQNKSQKKLKATPSSKASTTRLLKPFKSKGSIFVSKSSVASSKVSIAPTIQDSVVPAVSDETTVDDEKSPEVSPNRELKLVPHHRGKWSTRDIYEQSYDAETKTMTFYTGRLGTFAFATRKYSNFPLKSWAIGPEVSETEKFVVLKVETQNVNIEFNITNNGYTFKIFFSKKLPPQEQKTPVKMFELRKILSSQNLNLFPEVDASFYIENNCEKHKPMEFHTYKSMAVYCLSHNFKWSVWNRWAHRRVAIFESRMILKKNFKTIMTTPLMTASVNVHEKYTSLDVVELDYEMNPMEQEFRPDLLNFLDDEVDKREHRENVKNFMLIWFVQALLMNIQPLSFSL